jgi:SAM-dependent methyltransferase
LAARDVIDVGDTREMAMDLAEVLPRRVRAPFTASFVRSARLYDEFIHRLVLSVFRASGLGEAAAGEPSTPDELMARAGIERGRARAPVEWMLRRLSHRGVLEQSDGDGGPRFRLRAEIPELDPAAVREEQRREDATWMPSYVLAETVAQDYPAFLRGTRTGEEILFSPTRLRLWVDFFSNDNPLYAVNNVVGAGAALEWMPPGPLSIVELGGGLGSGAAALLDGLRRGGRWPEIHEYRFTELIPAFLRRGQQALQARFPDASFVKFGALDMNLPFEQQGVPPRSASLVYAVNTLHVARDLDRTLREIFQTLAPGGRLVFAECIRTTSAQAIYVEFVFNLMETFRAPVLNSTYRPNGGFLTPEQWRAAMEAAGFVDVALLPDIVAMRSRFPDFNVGAVGAMRPA